MKFNVIPIPDSLKAHVECIRTTHYDGQEDLAINVCVNGLPGIVFQHHNGYSPVERIATPSGHATDIPTLYVYGQMTQPGVMHHKHEPFTTTQIVLKPHALHTLLGLNASALTDSVVALVEFSSCDLEIQLLEAHDEGERIALLIGFLQTRFEAAKRTHVQDRLVEESLYLIHQHSGSVSVKNLLDRLGISERQFEKRFRQTVGLSPQFYIRVKRFNAALRLMQKHQSGTLTDLAHSLNFYDQSHFIRDVKAFSGVTPKSLVQKVEDFQPEHGVYAHF